MTLCSRIRPALAGFVSLLLAATTQPAVQAQSEGPPEDPHVVILELKDMVDDGMAVLVERAVKEAVSAEAIIFIIDTPGGKVDSAIKITDYILEAPCETIAYIKGMGAISAGALISYACDRMIMSSGATMGASTPIIMTQEGATPTGEKTVSFIRAKYRALANANGHNPDIAEAMADQDIELRAYRDELGNLQVFSVTHDGGEGAQVLGEDIVKTPEQEVLEKLERRVPIAQGVRQIVEEIVKEVVPEEEAPEEEAPEEDRPAVVVPENSTPAVSKPGQRVFEDGTVLILSKEKLLTMTASEAKEYGVIEIVADTLQECLNFLGLGELKRYEVVPTWSEEVFRWITSPAIAGLLLLLGLGGLYLEFQQPGFGLPGITGLVLLSLFFGAHFIIGLAEWTDVLLLAVGIGLILVEIFVLPGFGLAGMLGIVCLFLGVYLSLTEVAIPQYTFQYDRFYDALTTLAVALAGSFVFATLAWKLLPHTPMYHWLVLEATQNASEGYSVRDRGQAASYVGRRGIAVTLLAPTGKARFNGATLQVVCRGEYVSRGSEVEIIEASGNRYVVDPVQTQDHEGTA